MSQLDHGLFWLNSYHYVDEHVSMRAAASLLKPGGVFVFNIWGNFFSDTAGRQNPAPHTPFVATACVEHQCTYVVPTYPPPRLISPASVRAAATAAGLVIGGDSGVGGGSDGTVSAGGPVEEAMAFPIAFFVGVSGMTPTWPPTDPSWQNHADGGEQRARILARAVQLGGPEEAHSIFCVRYVVQKPGLQVNADCALSQNA